MNKSVSSSVIRRKIARSKSEKEAKRCLEKQKFLKTLRLRIRDFESKQFSDVHSTINIALKHGFIKKNKASRLLSKISLLRNKEMQKENTQQ